MPFSAKYYVPVLLVMVTAVSIALHALFTVNGVETPESGHWFLAISVLIVSLILNAFLFWRVTIAHAAKQQSFQEQQEKEHDSLHDPLTGAANRRSFEIRLNEMANAANPSHALLMIDLDNFKPVNDTYGHAAGDQLLCEITTGIRRLSRPADLVSRLGGDEFAILLTDVNANTAEDIACDVLDFVSRYRLTWKGQRVQVGTSIGLVMIDRPGIKPANLLEASDVALYAAKDAGRGAVMAMAIPETCSVDESFMHSAARRVDPGVPQATDSAQSHEPTDGRTQVLMGVSAVARITKRDERRAESRRGREAPRHWIAVEPATVGDSLTPGMTMRELVADAELRADGGADMVRWTFAMALSAASRVKAERLSNIGFSLPIPARSIVAVPTLHQELIQALTLSAHPIRHLTFVLQNVGKVYDDPSLNIFIDRMHSSGVRVAYQIRNTSVESMAALGHSSFDEIHLSREIHRSIRPGTSGYVCIKALQTIAKNAGVVLVASEVDNVASLQHLAQLGIQRISGPAVGTVQKLDKALEVLGG